MDPRPDVHQVRRTTAEKLGRKASGRSKVRPCIPSSLTSSSRHYTRSALRERTEAVEEILSNRSPKLTLLRELLRRLPDLARGLCRIQYGKCTPQELVTLLRAFNKVGTTFAPPHPSQPSQSATLKSKLLAGVLDALPKLKDPVKELCEAIIFKEAEAGREDAMWTDVEDRFPAVDSLMVVRGGPLVMSSESIDGYLQGNISGRVEFARRAEAHS